MFRKDDETRKVLVEIIELLGYLALGITIWELSKNLLVVAIYVLALLYLILLIRYRAKIQEVARLKNMLGEASKGTEELQRIQGLLEGMVGLFLFTSENPVADTQHHYTFVQEEYVVQGDDGTYNWYIQGCNILDEPSTGLFIKFSGDAPADVQSLMLSVMDRTTGQRYHDQQIRIIKDSPYLKIFEIVFSQPLQKNECFNLGFSCRWNNTFTRARKYDYVFFSWGHHAAKGTDKLIGRLVCDLPITDFVLERIDDGQLVKERSQPKIVDTSSKRFVLEWEVSRPQHVYLLRFTKDIGGISRIFLGG